MKSSSKIIDLQNVCLALFDSAAEGLLIIDMKGEIILCNPRAESLFGYSEEELIGKSIEILIPDHLREVHVKHRESYNDTPVPRSMGLGMDLLGRRKDSTTFPVEISLNAIETETGRMYMTLISDITRRKEAEAELEALNAELEKRVHERTKSLYESQRLYNIIARNYPNGTIIVLDKELRYVFAEGRELYRLGVSTTELESKPYLDRLPESVREIIGDKLRSLFSGGSTTFEVDFDGKQYELNAVALEDLEGNVEQILVVEHNVTRQKEAEKKITDALSKERQLNELKSRFVSMASHEFRTPLSTILTSSSLLERYVEGQSNEKIFRHINKIKSSVRNLTGILDDFLSFDKLESGNLKAEATEIEFERFANDVFEEIEVLAKTGQKINFSHIGANIVELDIKMLKNVMINLVYNAMKYSPEGAVIGINSVIDDQNLTVHVKDQGIGIPKDEQVHMFDRFFRARNAINIQGTGLGLNIVKRYLEIMGGDIWFESTEGKGSTFSFILPRKLKL